jgi:hypothetical protein
MEPRSAAQLAAEVRPYLSTADAREALEALLAKAEYQERVCDVCHQAAVDEGRRIEREEAKQ